MRRLCLLVLGLLLLGSAPAHAAGGDPLRSKQWALDMLGADQARAVTDGRGAVVAVVDSGVAAEHPDLARRILPGHDFVDNDSTPQDGNGHGTHVAGIIAADADNGIGIRGVAPGASILPVRVLDDDGSGDVATIAKGIDWAVDHGADVINLSLGEDVPVSNLGLDSAFDAALARAEAKGLIVVAASGNDGVPVCEQPHADKLLCVGAVDKRRQRSFFSSFGQGLALVAPGGSGLPTDGENILSTYPPRTYEELAGTSQAAPQVSGIAALLVSVGVRGQAAVQRILATASDAGVRGPDAEYGAGIANAQAAVAGLHPPPPPKAAVSVPRNQRIPVVLRHGLVARCAGAVAGACRVSVVRDRRTLAAGSQNVPAGRLGTLHANFNRRGRALLRHARRVAVTVRVRPPGAAGRSLRVTLRR